MIEVVGVGKKYGDVEALRDINISVAKGEVFGLLGPNGAGKTTLVRILATLLKQSSGNCTVGGFDTRSDPMAVRGLIGLAGQNAAIDNLLTGKENLEIVGRLYQLSRAEAKRRAAEILERLSLDDAADRLVKTYSGGMRRRIDLGASLVGRPQVLLLDEPTTGLDPRTRNELWEFLQELVAEGTTVLLTTQYLEEADELADRLAVLDNGTVIAEGTSDELKERLGGDVLMAVPSSPAQLGDTFKILDEVSSATPWTDEKRNKVTVSVDDRIGALLAAAQKFDEQNISLQDLAISRPSLDEVFLALTGKGVEEENSDQETSANTSGRSKK